MEKTQPGRTFSERTQRGANVCFSLVFLFSSLVFQVKLQAAWDNPLTWSSVNIPRKKMSLKTERVTDRSQDKTTSISWLCKCSFESISLDPLSAQSIVYNESGDAFSAAEIYGIIGRNGASIHMNVTRESDKKSENCYELLGLDKQSILCLLC